MSYEKMPGMDVTIERNVPATMRDGTVLHADVFRPITDEPVPVILSRSPYDKRGNVATFGNAHPAWYAKHGYMVVIQDVRGRYESEGEWYPFLHEMEDGYDSVEWAARLPGSNGSVGMLGFSYVGATQMLAAVMRPPSLKTIVPGFTASQYYDGWTYNGGALAVAFVCYWANLLALETATRHESHATLGALLASLGSAPDWFWAMPMSEYPPLQDSFAQYFYDWVEHHTYDDYWRRWSIDEDYSRIDVPALHVAGWYDVFLSGSVKNFNGLSTGGGSDAARSNQKLLVGPWTHMPWTPMGPSGTTGPSTNDIDDWHIRWYDQMLKGKDTGVLDSPVTIFTVDGEWCDLDAWPPSDAIAEDWHIHSDGRANSKYGDGTLDTAAPGAEPPDIFVYDAGVPIPSLGGHSCCFDSITPMGPADQHAAEVSRMMLVYTSEPLTDPMEILGNAEVTLYAASDAVDTDFTARLCVVDVSGRSVNLQEGILRARYRESLSEPELMTPGEVYEFTIDLGPVGAKIPAGSRLRLDISSSDFPQWDRNLNTGGVPLHEGPTAAKPATQTVFHSGDYASRVRLYVRR
jgi:putative CocE/NonD family hydrolase